MERRKAITPDIDRYLRYMYFNPKKSGSFSGITQFFNAVKEDGKYNLSKYMVAKWLRRNDVYTTTRKITSKFLRPTVTVSAIDATWEIDLADFSLYGAENNGYRYILVCIDVFSRYLWCVPLKSKFASDVIEGLKHILTTHGVEPEEGNKICLTIKCITSCNSAIMKGSGSHKGCLIDTHTVL